MSPGLRFPGHMTRDFRLSTMSKKNNLIPSTFSVLLVLIAALWAAFPFYWSIINSIKQPLDTFEPKWIPFLQFTPTLQWWQDELSIRETQNAMVNSTIIAVGAATLALVLGTLAGYALARFKFTRFKNENMTMWFLSQRVMPPAVAVIPYFIILSRLKMLDSHIALIFLNTTFVLSFAVVIMRQMFRDLPAELEEAALVDGTSYFGAFWRIALPLVAPGLVATWILCLAFTWNEFLMALSLTTKDAIPMPVIIAGSEHTRGVQFWFVGVRTVLTMLVPAALALAAQKYIVRGLTFGALKG